MGKLTDSQILARAHAMGRFVLTHDGDFGTLAVHRKEPVIGIPGAGVAYVQNGKVSWAEGFGVKNTNTGALVSGHTSGLPNWFPHLVERLKGECAFFPAATMKRLGFLV